MVDSSGHAIAILERLVAFETISGRTNLDFIAYVSDYLAGHGIAVRLSHDETGERANLHAIIGPGVDGGVLLNGHTDVVPVDGQVWSSDPFRLARRGDRLYGRGAVDMKGFLAAMLAMVPSWQRRQLVRPIHISMCYDEEIGGYGAPVLVEEVCGTGPRPAIALVGEPTGMRIVTGHKGGIELTTRITGLAAHASDPRKGANAILAAARLLTHMEEVGRGLAARPLEASPFDPAFATLNVGTIAGGAARNIVAGDCAFDWEVRPVPGTDGEAIVAGILAHAREVVLPELRASHPTADIATEVTALVPSLDPSGSGPAVALLTELSGRNDTEVVSFGTDAGFFARAGMSSAVFGPGNISEAHKPDEFIEIVEIERCLDFLDRLGARLERAL
ncbi:MAG: acetylornithine deacetylase [Rhizobiales bacterium]|nr:acetylornithine deacetylase [Hyphomicrobiales bacterium]